MTDTPASLRALFLALAVSLMAPLVASVPARADAPVDTIDDAPQPDEEGDGAQPTSPEIAGPSGSSLTWWWWWVPNFK